MTSHIDMIAAWSSANAKTGYTCADTQTGLAQIEPKWARLHTLCGCKSSTAPCTATSNSHAHCDCPIRAEHRLPKVSSIARQEVWKSPTVKPRFSNFGVANS